MSNNDFTGKAWDGLLRGWLAHYFRNSTSHTVDHTERVEARQVGVHLWCQRASLWHRQLSDLGDILSEDEVSQPRKVRISMFLTPVSITNALPSHHDVQDPPVPLVTSALTSLPLHHPVRAFHVPARSARVHRAGYIRTRLSIRSAQVPESKNQVPKMTTLSVVQYNVLAEGLSNPAMATDAGFTSMSADQMTWKHRGALVLKKIKDADADVVCLQEVDHYYDSVEPAMRDAGYSGIYREDEWSPCRQNSGGKLKDGVAIFYRRSELELVGMHMPFTPRAEKVTIGGAYDAGKSLMARFRVLGTGPEITRGARYAEYVSATEEIIVCTSHFAAAKNEEGEARRQYQARNLRDEIIRFRDFSDDDIDEDSRAFSSIPVIFAGDLNAKPDEGTVRYLKEGSGVTGILDFFSTYEKHLGCEPNFTTWKKRMGSFKPGEAKMTIDYIFASVWCETVDVSALPTMQKIGDKALPCAEHPSDHLMLRAVIKLPSRG